ncbi:(Fe-S)-binding protein [Acidobacteriota bacterium]
MEITLFATCLIEHLFPDVGKATVRLLESLGHNVDYHSEEPCCGQFAYNSGYRSMARKMARQFVECFSSDAVVVTPSGSCASMIRHKYPLLFQNDPLMLKASQELGSRLLELSEFLVTFDQVSKLDVEVQGRIYYHESCHMHNELGVRNQPHQILSSIETFDLCPPVPKPPCCGFGGTFSLKFPEISAAIMNLKLDAIIHQNPTIVTAGDMGCLMHIWGGLRRRGNEIPVLHLAELLTGNIDESSLR